MSSLDATDPQQLERINPATDTCWAELAATRGDVFHSPAWMRVLALSYELEPTAWIVRDSHGRARSGLASCSIVDPGGSRSISLPFSDYCDPLLGDDSDWTALADRWLAHDVLARTRCLHSKAPLRDSRLESHGWAYWHATELERSKSAVWESLHPSAKRAIRKAEAAGIEVRSARNRADLRAFFDLHLKLRKEKYKLLAQPFRFFEALWSEFLEPGHGSLLLAEDNNRIIAGVLLLESNSRLYYKLNASDPTYLAARPNDLLVWNALEYGRAHELEHLDFGVSDHDQPGLVRYKRKFATREERVTFLRRPAARTELASSQDWRATLCDMTQLFTAANVPDHVTERAGDDLYRYFT